MKNSFCTLFLAVGTLLSFNVNAQSNPDSLKGFDEREFNAIATSKKLIETERKYFLELSKREFINHKYHLRHADNTQWVSVQTQTVIQAPCTNVDFENGTFSGWNVSYGVNNNSLSMAGCCANVGVGVASVINGSGFDPLISTMSLVSPFGGNKIVKLNDASAGNKAQRISQTFYVTQSNAVFQVAYCAVLNSGGHDCFEQPFMNISVKDSAGNVLACPKIDIQAPDPACAASSTVIGWVNSGIMNQGGAVYYRTWDLRTIDLSQYIGTNITVQITVADCIYTAHYGYGYFDFKCNPLEITTNGSTQTLVNVDSVFISPCGNLAANISVPEGLGPYYWQGPPGSPVTGATTASISTNIPGQYTVTMNPPGSCTGIPIVRKATLRITPSPTATAIAAQPTCSDATGSGQINVSSGTGPFTFSWTPTASNSDIANGLTPGTNYTIVVTDSMGCKDTTSLSINPFPDAPTFTITPLNGVITCASPSLTLNAILGNNTTAVWTGTTTASINVTTPGNYSVVLTNTASVGQCSTTVNVTVMGNTVQPTATYTVSCNTATIALNASSQPGVALGWLAPTLPSPSPVGNPGTSTAIGIYTLTATNLSTGCKQTYTASTNVPQISISTNPSTNLITCFIPTVLATTTSTNPGVSITWLNGVGTSTANPYAITAAGTYTTVVSAPGGCSTQSVITVTSNTVADVFVTSPGTVIPCYTNSLTLTANSSSPVPYTYSWVPAGFAGNPYTVSNAGNYTVTATNSVNGCIATVTYSVSKETVTAQFSANPTTGLMPLPVTLTNESINGENYFWNLGNSSNTYTTTNASTIYDFQGTYTVTLIVTKGFCSDTAVTSIIVDMVSFITIPNVFTPNGDGKNDIFSLHPINIGDISMTIFDRWGLKMYDTTSTGSLTWDGKTKGGADVADGTYFYIITAKGLDGKDFNFQGTVNIFR